MEVVWFQLFIDGVEVGGVARVKVPEGAIIADLIDLVKLKCSNNLAGFDIIDLRVFASASDEATTDDSNRLLKPNESVPVATTFDAPLIVKAEIPKPVRDGKFMFKVCEFQNDYTVWLCRVAICLLPHRCCYCVQ
jgi:hypothetical protein